MYIIFLYILIAVDPAFMCNIWISSLMTYEVSLAEREKKTSGPFLKRTIAIWNWFLLSAKLCPIPSRLIRSARYDSSRTQVYAYVAVNGSSLCKKTATTDRRHDLFGTLVRSPK